MFKSSLVPVECLIIIEKKGNMYERTYVILFVQHFKDLSSWAQN